MRKSMRCLGVFLAAVAGYLCAESWLADQPGVAQSSSEQEMPAHATVRTFGALGDGIADDTAAIQKCIDSGIGDVCLPRGVYRLTKPLLIDLDKVGPTSVTAQGTATVVMAAAGPAFRFLGTHGGTAAPRTVKPEVWERQRTPMIDGVEIVGAHPNAVGVESDGTMQMIFSRVTVRSALHGIHLVNRNRNVIISKCHLYDNHGIGLYLDGLNLHQINVTGSHISYNDGGGIVVRDSEIRNLHIGTCDIEGNMGVDGPPTANILFDTANGTVREGSIVGCTIQHNHDAPNSANIRFIGRSAAEPQKVGHFTIGDNALSDVAVNIDLQYARGVTITNNTFWKAFQHNLLVDGCSNIIVGPNLFDRNPDYRPNDSPNGLLFRDSQDCTLSGLHINNTLKTEAGLVLENCRWFNVTGCTILDCDGRGILLKNVTDSRISDSVIRDARPDLRTAYVAISVDGGGRNQIANNRVAGKIAVDTKKNDVRDNLQDDHAE